MILVDTSVWVDHLRSGDARLERMLEDGDVLAHTWVIGELALGNVRPHSTVLGLLLRLARASHAADDELRAFISRHKLHGSGLGYVDAQLLASTRLTPGALLWTRERRLASVAERMGVAFRT